MKNKDSYLLFSTIRDFLNSYLPQQRGYGENTIKSYREGLNQFVTFACGIYNIKLRELRLANINRELVEKYLNYVELERGCSIQTRNQRLSAIRSFFKYAADVSADFVSYYQDISAIPAKKTNKSNDISFFSEKALSAILSTPNPKLPIGSRDLLFMIMLYDTGARVQELLDLKIKDLRIGGKERYIIVTGKGGKIRDVPIMERTKEHILEYLKKFHNSNSDNQFLFYTVRNGCHQKMSQDNVARFIQKYAALARTSCIEVPEKVYPHMFRHSRAMHLYRSGMPLPLVSEWLGHAQMETTVRFYANADLTMKQDAIERATSKLSPLVSSLIEYKYEDNDETLRKLYGLV